jgi:hypothetical protein
MKATQTKLSRLALVALSSIALGRERKAAEAATKMRCWVAILLAAAASHKIQTSGSTRKNRTL